MSVEPECNPAMIEEEFCSLQMLHDFLCPYRECPTPTPPQGHRENTELQLDLYIAWDMATWTLIFFNITTLYLMDTDMEG